MEEVVSTQHAYKTETLYAIDKKGAIRSYSAIVTKVGSIARVTSFTGVLGSTKQRVKSDLIKVGKNAGKSNATTPLEQAISETKSDFTKKLKEGYKTFKWLQTSYETLVGSKMIENFAETNATVDGLFKSLSITHNTDHNNRIKPMLAEKFDSVKNRNFPYYIQPKFNGVRCLSHKEDDNIVLISREGEEYHLEHIKRELKKLFLMFPTYVFDGELYSHDVKLQDIASLVKSPSDRSIQICYYIYDIAIPNSKQWSRFSILEDLKQIEDFKYIKFANTYIVSNLQEISDYDFINIKDGFEGSIVREYQGLYEFSFRSSNLLKVKTTQSEDFTITGVNKKDNSNDEDFVWVCKTNRNKSFEVRPHGTIAERLFWFKNSHLYIGKKLQLEFFEYTKDLIPFHITSVVIRNYE
jgi:ATP-dependent DNA ligase